MKRRLIPGRITRPDAARNARPRKVLLSHGRTSRLLRYADLDLRSAAGRAYQARVLALTVHIGGDPSEPQKTLIDHAARLHLLTKLAWDELTRRGAFKGGAPTPAHDAWRRSAAEERAVLATLGIERREKPVPTLDEYLEQKSRERKPLTFKRTADVEDAEEV